MATTKYGNKYKSDEGTYQVYVTYSTSETATTYTITSTYHIKAITALKKNSIVSWGMTYDLSGSQSGSSSVAVPTMSKGATKQIFSRSRTYTKDTSAQTWSVKFYASNKIISWGATDDSSVVSASVTIPALASYNVTFNANGSSGAPGTQKKYYGKSLALSSTRPTRTGYTFKGWATSASGAVAYQPGGTYTGNAALTLYAIWQINTYAVSYNSNGGSGAVGNQTKTYGQNLTLSNGASLSRTYYTLKNWNTAADGSGTTYPLSDTYTGNAALTLYAIWQQNYVLPKISSFKAYRVSSASSSQGADDGEYIRIEASYEPGYFTEDPTAYQEGTLTIKINGVSVHTATISTADSIALVFSPYNKDSSHDVVLTITDAQGSVQREAMIPTAIYPIDLYGSGQDVYMGVMHKYEQGQEVTTPDIYIDGDIYIAYDSNAGSGTDYETIQALNALGWGGTISNGGVFKD